MNRDILFLIIGVFFLTTASCDRRISNGNNNSSDIDSEEVESRNGELDKNLFKVITLPTDTYGPYALMDNTIDKIWDGIYNVEAPSFVTPPGSGLPQWFTFYLGVDAKLTKLKLYQRGDSEKRLYSGGNLKKFEVWGSDNPDPDGSWDSWTLLMEGESVKPSGLPAGQVSQEDLDYILAGEDFEFPDDIPSVKFLRIKTLENWDEIQKREYANIGEITLWGEGIKIDKSNAGIINNPKDDGYRGIWYSVGDVGGEYKYKYAGGLGTYPVNIYPYSVYSSDSDKTYFCYGGSEIGTGSLLHEVGYYDHKSGKVSRPTIVLNKQTDDGHDNPCIQVDKDGYIWLFSNSHGTSRPGFIHRSAEPHDIDRFENVHPTKLENGQEVSLNNFSYLQVYYKPDKGFLGLFTHYENQNLKYGPRTCRVAGYMTSEDGIHWSEWKDLANMEEGSYQNSTQKGDMVGTAFNYHPTRTSGLGLDYRTNLYYLQSDDFGKTWKTVGGASVNLPLTEVDNAALVHDYESEGLLVFINDVHFDENDNPVILYETTKGWEPGSENGPRNWYTARWTGSEWEILPFTTSDNNYDMGSLYIEDNGSWRVVAPTSPGPQPYNTGGELIMWESNNQGKDWQKIKTLTPNSQYNHQYPRRPVNVNPGFYSFWADGHGRTHSESSLYFSTKDGKVFKLPPKMTEMEESPISVY